MIRNDAQDVKSEYCDFAILIRQIKNNVYISLPSKILLWK